MKQSEGIFYNWVNYNIGGLLKDAPKILQQYPFLLITSVDSHTDLRDLPLVKKIFDDPELNIAFAGSSVVLSEVNISKLTETYSLFTGFDEIWCFTEEPAVTIPQDRSLVAPRQVSHESLVGWAEWMSRSKCVLGLGDGIGLNYVTSVSEVASQIEELAENKLDE